MFKFRMLISKLAAALPLMADALYSLVSFTAKASITILAIVGFLYILDFVVGSKTSSQGQSGYMNIVLDETRLVRCKNIDRSQPSCTLLSDCDDQVDRCVVTFEILRRPMGPADYLPTEGQSESLE